MATSLHVQQHIWRIHGCSRTIVWRMVEVRINVLVDCVRRMFTDTGSFDRFIGRCSLHWLCCAILIVHAILCLLACSRLVRCPFPIAGSACLLLSSRCVCSLLSFALRNDALNLVKSTIGAWGSVFHDITSHLARSAALTCFGSSPLDAFARSHPRLEARSIRRPLWSLELNTGGVRRGAR